MKNKTKIIMVTFFAAILSTIAACSEETFTDPRDGETYKTARFGNKIWMAENLRYKGAESVCYLNNEKECSKGRFYSLLGKFNACPKGWHLPSKEEAADLINNLKHDSNEDFVHSNGYYVNKKLNFVDYEGDRLWTNVGLHHIQKWAYLELKTDDRVVYEDRYFAIRCVKNADDMEQ